MTGPRAYYVYLLACADDTTYAGIALDVDARVEQHNRGRGAKYTRGRGPVVVLDRCGPLPHGDALRLERALKDRRGRPAKLALLAEAAAELRRARRRRRRAPDTKATTKATRASTPKTKASGESAPKTKATRTSELETKATRASKPTAKAEPAEHAPRTKSSRRRS